MWNTLMIRREWMLKILLVVVFLMLIGIIILLLGLAAIAFRLAGCYQVMMENMG